MKLYIMRHGHSPAAADARVPTDAERPLSERGRAQARGAAQNLLSRGARPQLLLASPLLRAQQTAETVLSLLRPAPRRETFTPLSNELPGAQLLARLRRENYPEDEIILIGHQPQLGELATHLSGRVLSLSTAGVIALETQDRGPARVLWTHSPEE